MFSFRIRKVSIVFFMLPLFCSVLVFAQDKFEWDKELVQKVKIVDKQIVNKLVYSLFIPESDVEYIEIFDVDKNGAAEGDLLKVFPSKNVYSLSMLDRESQDILSNIPHPANIEDVGFTINIGKPETATQRILFILAKTIKKLYSEDKPLKLYFQQNEDGTYRFEFFGYNPDVLKDKDVNIGDNNVRDLLKALYKEFNEEIVDWQPTVIHIVKTERDTLYVPENRRKK